MKIAILCSQFKKSNVNKLPWKYIFEVANYLDKNNEVFIITDATDRNIGKLNIINVKKLFIPLKGETEEVLDILKDIDPDKCIMLMGMTSFLRTEFRIKQPVIGIFTSPLYSIKELFKNIGLINSIKYKEYTFIHFINSLTPQFLVNKWSNKIEKMIFLSHYTKNKLISKGYPAKNSFFVPCGVDEIFFDKPGQQELSLLKNKINPDNKPIIMYLTSPLTLRGSDTLVKSFINVRKQFDCRLIYLCRMDKKELNKEVEILKKIALDNDIMEYVDIIPENLNPDEVKQYISISDIICLPFKIVMSDIPISLIESQLMNKTVVSTNVAGVSEIVDDKFLVEPNNHKELAKLLLKCLNNDIEEKKKHPTYNWKSTGIKIQEILINS